MKKYLMIVLAFVLLFGLQTASLATSGDPETFTITVAADPPEGGTVMGGGVYQPGQNVTISAIPNEGYTFAGWFRSDGTPVEDVGQEFEYDLEQTRTYTAKFEKALTVNIIAEPAVGGTVSQSGGGSYMPDESVTLTAVSAEGYSFIGWFDASSPITPVTTDSTYTFNVSMPMSFIAKYAARYQLDANVSPEGSGSVLGAGQYPGGSIVALEVIPAEDYRFVGWVLPADPEQIVSEDIKHTFNLDQNTTYTAKFARSYAYYGTRVALVAVICAAGAAGVYVLIRRMKTIRRKGYRRHGGRRR